MTSLAIFSRGEPRFAKVSKRYRRRRGRDTGLRAGGRSEMARYDYQCEACGEIFEVEHPMGEHPEVSCPVCGGHAEHHFDPSGIVFKGSGYYNTDQRNSHTSAAPAETPTQDTGSNAETSPKEASSKDAGSAKKSSKKKSTKKS